MKMSEDFVWECDRERRGLGNVLSVSSPTATCTELNLGYCNDLDYTR